jgi:hypothetical protein
MDAETDEYEGAPWARYLLSAADLGAPARKVEAFARAVPPRHTLDSALYDTVVATSDVHADFAKLLQIMASAGLVELPEGHTGPYDPRVVTDSAWVADRTLFVVCGDLVDGRRGDGDVDDPRGSYELLLHCFLFNMRVRARAAGSEVLFTVGNHDLHTVIKGDDALNHYVGAGALAFFGGRQRRAEALRPFYACSPYLILALGSPASPYEVVFVHGALRKGRQSLLERTLAVQRAVDAGGGLGPIRDERFAHEDHTSWRREYTMRTRCAGNGDLADLGCRLVVVGHCTTHSYEALKGEWDAQCASKRGDAAAGTGAGCVLVTCAEPMIALVDTAMSGCFYRDAGLARARGLHVLLLTRGAGERSTGTYAVGRALVGPSPMLVVGDTGVPLATPRGGGAYV